MDWDFDENLCLCNRIWSKQQVPSFSIFHLNRKVKIEDSKHNVSQRTLSELVVKKENWRESEFCDSVQKKVLFYGTRQRNALIIWMLLFQSTLLFSLFQHYLTMLGGTLSIPFILSGPMCFGSNTLAISEVLSTILFVSGVVTLLQSTFGVR